MKETTPSDRVQLIGQGQLMHPGCCALCGSGNSDDGYVDTGIYYDYEGQVYFCWTCAHQIASVIGCLSAEETAHLQGLLSDAATELASVKAELEDTRGRLNTYDAILARAFDSGNLGSVPAGPNARNTKPTTEQPESELSGGTTESSDDGESNSKESVKGGGRRKPPRTQRSDGSTADSFTI